jgi:hypothetical protein
MWHKQLGRPTGFAMVSISNVLDSSRLNCFTLLQCPEFPSSPCFPAVVCNDAVISAQISCPKALKILRLVELAHSAIEAVAFAYTAIFCYSIVHIFFSACNESYTTHPYTIYVYQITIIQYLSNLKQHFLDSKHLNPSLSQSTKRKSSALPLSVSTSAFSISLRVPSTPRFARAVRWRLYPPRSSSAPVQKKDQKWSSLYC